MGDTRDIVERLPNELDELLGHYFELGVAEGAQGRSHDTEAGEAQATLDLIRLRIERAIKAADSDAMERAAQIADKQSDELTSHARDLRYCETDRRFYASCAGRLHDAAQAIRQASGGSGT